MAKTARKMSYEEFRERLPEVLDELARAHETVLIEKNGNVYSLEIAGPLFTKSFRHSLTPKRSEKR